jgi:hypothetical protein
MSKPMDIVVPIELLSGKTIWQKIGTAFENDDPSKKHTMMISITAIPTSTFIGNEIRAFIYPTNNKQNDQPLSPPKPPSVPPDANVSF